MGMAEQRPCARVAGLQMVHIWEEMAWEAAVGLTAIEAAYQLEGGQCPDQHHAVGSGSGLPNALMCGTAGSRSTQNSTRAPPHDDPPSLLISTCAPFGWHPSRP